MAPITKSYLDSQLQRLEAAFNARIDNLDQTVSARIAQSDAMHQQQFQDVRQVRADRHVSRRHQWGRHWRKEGEGERAGVRGE